MAGADNGLKPLNAAALQYIDQVPQEPKEASSLRAPSVRVQSALQARACSPLLACSCHARCLLGLLRHGRALKPSFDC